MCVIFETKDKILIIRLSSLGDVLLTTPVLRAIKKKYPNVEINFLVKPQYADAVKYNPYISRLLLYNSLHFQDLLKEIKSIDCDIVVDLQNNFRSRKLTMSLGIKTYLYSKPTVKKFLLVKFKINLLKDLKSIPQRYVEAVDALELDSEGLDLLYPDNIASQLHEKENYIGFCPGAQHFTKKWLPHYYIELGNLLTASGFTIVIFGGSSDENICDEISKGINGSINLQNNNNLFQTAADMKKCKLIISNDSGLMHTASAVGVPLISIFGSSVKEFGFVPYGVRNLILENNSLNCRPCSHIGRAKCPKGHFKCIKDITPQLVFAQLQIFLKNYE